MFASHHKPSQRRGLDALERRIAQGALHHTADKHDPPKCSPRTHSALISAIMDWADDTTRDSAMLWFYGPPGAGKSAVMQRIAQIAYDKGSLAASFFFARNAPTRNTEKHLMPTLAYQIAISIPDTRRYIARAIEDDPAIFNASLEAQLNALIINPLAEAYAAAAEKGPAPRRWPRLVVIDGLDHCHGPNIQRYIVRILSTALITRRIPLFILVASKPEPPIRDSFNSYDLREYISTLVLDDSYLPDADLKRYFWSRFEHIKQTHPLRTYIPSSWPSSQIIAALVQRSAGQYVYATTVVRYVDSSQHRPVERLEAVLRIVNRLGEVPFAELDALYRHIFSSVHNLKTVLRVLGALLFAQRLFSKRLSPGDVSIPVTDPRFLEELLSLNRGDIYFLLGDLHAILSVPDPKRNGPQQGTSTAVAGASSSKPLDTGIKILHASLIDFLTDRSRAGKYFINSVKVHAELARACAKNLLSGHKFVHQYAGQALVTHCRYSVLTNELLNDLYGFDLAVWLSTCKSWNDGSGGPFDQAWVELPNLMSWFATQTVSDQRKDLHKRHMGAWERYLEKELVAYVRSGTSNGSGDGETNGDGEAREGAGEGKGEGEGSLEELLPFVTYPELMWDWIHVWPLLGVPYDRSVHLESLDRQALHLTGLKQQFDAYRHLLAEYLTDERRSGPFYVTPRLYARVALKLAKYLFEPKKPGKMYMYKLPEEWKWYREDYDDKIFREKKTKETFQAGMQYFAFFIGKAGVDKELEGYVRGRGLDRVRAEELTRQAWAEDKVKVEKGVEDYLERCKGTKMVVDEPDPGPSSSSSLPPSQSQPQPQLVTQRRLSIEGLDASAGSVPSTAALANNNNNTHSNRDRDRDHSSSSTLHHHTHTHNSNHNHNHNHNHGHTHPNQMPHRPTSPSNSSGRGSGRGGGGAGAGGPGSATGSGTGTGSGSGLSSRSTSAS